MIAHQKICKQQFALFFLRHTIKNHFSHKNTDFQKSNAPFRNWTFINVQNPKPFRLSSKKKFLESSKEKWRVTQCTQYIPFRLLKEPQASIFWITRFFVKKNASLDRLLRFKLHSKHAIITLSLLCPLSLSTRSKVHCLDSLTISYSKYISS